MLENETIVHIGHHKTGTTSIQESLKINSKALMKKELYVPLDFCGRHTTNHYELNVVSLNADRSSPMKDKMKGKVFSLTEIVQKSIANTYKRAQELGLKRVIWSNEGLSLLRHYDEYERLANLFRPYSMRLSVVLCIRDKEEFKASWKKQLSRMGLDELSEPSDSYRHLGESSWLLDWTERLSHIISIFDQVKVYKYHQHSSVRDFFTVIGINGIESLDMDELFLNRSI